MEENDGLESVQTCYLQDIKDLVQDNVDMMVLGEAVAYQLNSTVAYLSERKYRQCLSHSKIVLDFVWEKLNQGHWKDIDINWRYVYTTVSVMKAICEYCLLVYGDNCINFEQVMKSCDLGLLMGAPMGDNILAGLCSYITEDFQKRTRMTELRNVEIQESVEEYREEKGVENISESESGYWHTSKKLKVDQDALVLLMRTDRAIKRVSCPSLEAFRKEFVTKERPVIITDAMDGWPALGTRKWSVDYIKKIAGHRTVPIEIGSKYTDQTWSQKLMTVHEFIEKYFKSKTSENEIGYLAQHQLFNQIPQLQKDILIPDYCYLGESEDVDINAWFGPKGTVSPLHYDPKHNFLAQVVGEKYIRIYPISETDRLYPHHTTLLNNTSQVDLENPDFERFPQFKDASYMDCVLRSGEMLYIPPKFWHFVKSLSVSFSVSFWWE